MIDILIEKFISKKGKEKKIIKTIIKPNIGERKKKIEIYLIDLE